jgi:hypothetical protein
MARWFTVNPEFEDVSTRNYLGLNCPFFRVPLAVRNNATGQFVHHPIPFLWDTGSHLCMVSRVFALRYSLRLHDTDDRIPGGIGGVGGSQPAWLTTMKVQFPLLSKRRREPDLAFQLHVIVVDQLAMPILGTRDVLRNFSAESTWDGTTFTLNRDHHGEAA